MWSCGRSAICRPRAPFVISILLVQWAQAFVMSPLRISTSVAVLQPFSVHRYASVRSADVHSDVGYKSLDAKAAADSLFAEAVGMYERLAGIAAAPDTDAVVKPLQLLDEVFRLDFEVVKASQYGAEGARTIANVTCMRPRSVEDRQNPQLQNEALAAVDLQCGRACLGGFCSEGCSRVQLPHFASAAECSEMVDRCNFYLPGIDAGVEKRNLPIQIIAAIGDMRLHLLYIRLTERLRRTIAYEYGVDASLLSPCATFVNRLHAGLNPDEYDPLNTFPCPRWSWFLWRQLL